MRNIFRKDGLPKSMRLVFRDKKDALNWKRASLFKKTHLISKVDLQLESLNLLVNDPDYLVITLAKSRGEEVIYSIRSKGKNDTRTI